MQVCWYLTCGFAHEFIQSVSCLLSCFCLILVYSFPYDPSIPLLPTLFSKMTKIRKVLVHFSGELKPQWIKENQLNLCEVEVNTFSGERPKERNNQSSAILESKVREKRNSEFTMKNILFGTWLPETLASLNLFMFAASPPYSQ